MPPKEELFRPFEDILRVSGAEGETELEWLASYGFLFFRPLGAPPELLWFGSFVTSWDSWGATPDQVRRHLESGVRSLWSFHRFFRVIFLPDDFGAPAGSWLALQPKTVGVVCGLGERFGNWNSAAFQSFSFEFIKNGPADTLLAVAKTAIEADEEEWRNTLAWAQIEREERFWFLVSWERGGPDEWLALMSALLSVAAVKGATLPNGATARSYSWRVFVPLPKHLPSFPAPLQMNSQHLANAALELMRLAQLHLGALVDFSRSRFNVDGPFLKNFPAPTITIDHPTQHELMETLALWRDFGRQSNQLERVEELLRELLA